MSTFALENGSWHDGDHWAPCCSGSKNYQQEVDIDDGRQRSGQPSGWTQKHG